MADDFEPTQQVLVSHVSRDLLSVDLGLVTRGLTASERMQVTSREITAARANNLAFAALSNVAVKIAIEQEANWRHRLFAQIITDEIRQAGDLLTAFTLRKVTPQFNMLDSWQVPDLIKSKFDAFSAILDRLTLSYPDKSLFAESEEPSRNFDGIIQAAHEYGIIYRDLLYWSLDIISWRVHTAFTSVQMQLAYSILPTITRLGFFGSDILSIIDNAALACDEGGQKLSLTLTPEFHLPEGFMDEVLQATLISLA